jgi:hypothetical protein
MQGVFLRKYGQEAKMNFVLYQSDGTELKSDAVHASGDTKIMKDEAAEANTANGFVDEGQGYSLILTAMEMQAARIVVYIVDQGTKQWLDTVLVIETYGNTNATHKFDLDSNVVHKASKILVNKAVQNKSTGEIDYYDDDGQMVILTHTPTDSESEITRTPS